MTCPRVLVVDDEPEILRCLRPALTACGFEVLAAVDGKEALRAIAASAPDIVLLDLGLPDIDGKEVITQARAFSKAPIIVLSARDREAEKIMALDAGADDYVEKPFAIGELMARLRAAIRHASRDAGKIERIERGAHIPLLLTWLKRLVTKALALPIEFAGFAKRAYGAVKRGRLF